MNTLIVYMTSHGCTAKASSLIRELLPGEVTLVNLENSDPPSLDSYETVIIGGSIRIGSIQKRIRKYCEKNEDILLTKKVGLFICCMYEGATAREQLQKNFPESLWRHATTLGLFGGELDFGQLTAFERMIVQQVANVAGNVSTFNEKAVRAFTLEMMGTG